MTKPPKKKPSVRAHAFLQFLRSVGDRLADAAERTEVPYTTLHSFANGKTQALTRAVEEKIVAAYGLSDEEISGGALPETRQLAPANPDAVLIGKDHFWPVPVFDIRAAAGAGALVEDGDPTTYQIFRDQFLQRVTRAPLASLSVIQVGGDSMWETLHDGDHILVDRSVNRVVKDGIYVLRYDDELLVKRCQRDLQSGAVIISSDNPRYKPMTVSDPRILDVIGRVVWIGRSVG